MSIFNFKHKSSIPHGGFFYYNATKANWSYMSAIAEFENTETIAGLVSEPSNIVKRMGRYRDLKSDPTKINKNVKLPSIHEDRERGRML